MKQRWWPIQQASNEMEQLVQVKGFVDDLIGIEYGGELVVRCLYRWPIPRHCNDLNGWRLTANVVNEVSPCHVRQRQVYKNEVVRGVTVQVDPCMAIPSAIHSVSVLFERVL
jgi:hypothetical protein